MRAAALVGLFLLVVGCGRESDRAAPILTGEERGLLRSALVCEPERRRALLAEKASPGSGHGSPPAPADTTAFCGLATDALCTSVPASPLCRARPLRGAYGGYYLMRYLMPLVVLTRTELNREDPGQGDAETTLAGLLDILRLLQPEIGACAGSLRTWCTVSGTETRAVPPHQLTVAYLVSEILRLGVERGMHGSHDTRRLLRRTFDVLLWDHALLLGTDVRNSQTERWRVAPAVGRMRHQHADFETRPLAAAPIQFQVDGWLIGVAANLLAVDELATGDPGLTLAPRERTALNELVAAGRRLLEQRLEPTEVFDFDGERVEGAMYDRLLWDRHEYRRFSAVTGTARPVAVAYDSETGAARTSLPFGPESRAEGVGHDSGHYRRVTWLLHTLTETGSILGERWVSAAHSRSLANQFAYAVFLHRCHRGCDGGAPQGREVPAFANYASGHDGWYRVTPEEPCEPGVPPSGFSTLMLLSENLWWARFNPDVGGIWKVLGEAIRDPAMPAPSNGVDPPCSDVPRRVWHETYREKALRPDGSLTYHGLAYYAMRRWAETALTE